MGLGRFLCSLPHAPPAFFKKKLFFLNWCICFVNCKKQLPVVYTIAVTLAMCILPELLRLMPAKYILCLKENWEPNVKLKVHPWN